MKTWEIASTCWEKKKGVCQSTMCNTFLLVFSKTSVTTSNLSTILTQLNTKFLIISSPCTKTTECSNDASRILRIKNSCSPKMKTVLIWLTALFGRAAHSKTRWVNIRTQSLVNNIKVCHLKEIVNYLIRCRCRFLAMNLTFPNVELNTNNGSYRQCLLKRPKRLIPLIIAA